MTTFCHLESHPKCHPEQLQVAWQRVRQGSAAAGVDQITPELFSGIQDTALRRFSQQINRECYTPSPAKGFYLKKPKGGHRLIGIPTVADRIVQRYLLHQLYPYLEAQFAHCCYAYRPGYSIYQAVAQLRRYYLPQTSWLLKADIHQFFDQICWSLLFTALEKLQIAPALLNLLQLQLSSGLVLNGQCHRPGRGLLQGGVLSGALANLYLTSFDWKCLEQKFPLVRYGDDFIVACRSSSQAEGYLSTINQEIQQLGLTLQPEKTQIIPPGEPFTFLGHQFAQGQVTPPIQRPQTAKPKTQKRQGGKPLVCGIRRPPSDPPPITSRELSWSEPMSTLYVTDQGAYLKVDHQQFEVIYQNQLRAQVPVNRVSHIILFGCCNLSHGAVSLALSRHIPVIYLSNQGRYFGRLETAGQAQVDYLTAQVKHSLDPQFTLRQAQQIVAGKLHNARTLLQRLNRKKKLASVSTAVQQLATFIAQIPAAESTQSLFGYEGQASQVYFKAYGELLREPFCFDKRTRRPPTDPVNSMLSLAYTLLHHQVYSFVETIGLHTHFGNLHALRPNHPALVCDLVEQFRAPVVDSFVAYLVNNQIFDLEDFMPADERGGVYFHPNSLKRFLKLWEECLQREITHPHTGYRVNYRRCLELQVWEYTALLKGEQPLYRPMLWNYS